MSVFEMQPGEMGSLSSRIYNKIREGLISGSFAPGTRLLMQDLAEQLGVSVTPVREACLRLVSEQALELRSGRFVNVPELTRDRYMQVALIRKELEGLAAELAVDNVTDGDIAELATIHAQFVKSESNGDLDDARKANRDFHFGVYRASNMPMLVSQIENMWVSMGPILNVYYREVPQDYKGAGEHDNMIIALKNRDKKLARASAVNDIARAGVSFLKYFDKAGL